MPKNFRWKRCYETCDGDVLWAIIDDESEKTGRVSDFLLVVNHEFTECLGVPFEQCTFPQRIIALLNSDESYYDLPINKMRGYKSPSNGKPFSEEGIIDLEEQLFDASRAGDSSLLEMAALAIRRLRTSKPSTAHAAQPSGREQ